MAETDLLKVGFKKSTRLLLAQKSGKTRRGEEQTVLTAHDEDWNELPAVTFFKDQLPFFAIIDGVTIVVYDDRTVLFKKAVVYASKHGVPRRLHHHAL